MPKKKYLYIILITVLLATTFIYSYNWSMNKFKNKDDADKKSNVSASDIDKLTANLNVDDTIPSGAKIVLKVQYKKSGDVVSREVKSSDYAGKSKIVLEKEGYIIESLSKDQVNLLKTVDSYMPNKYIVGVKGENYAIYKTNEKSEMILEQTTDIKVPSEREYDNLVKGSKYYQCDSKEEAEDKLGDGI